MSLLPRSRELRFALLALLVAALAVRVLLGLPKLNSLRYWDERYGVENLVALLEHGQLRPANGFHPTLSYFPQAVPLAISEGLHAVTGLGAFDAVGDSDLTPTGYLLCRLSQALLGVASLWLFFLIARRLHDETVAVVGVLLLAAVPWHIRQSAIYKPDILLVLTTLLALHLALLAVARPTLRRWLVAGVGVGIALASKFNAGPAAIPLTVGAALAGWRDRRQWGWLVGAGAAAVITLLVLDPWLLTAPELYRSDFGRTLRDYASKAARAGTSSPWHVFVEGLESLLGPSFHGPLFGTLGLAGLAVLVTVAARRIHRGSANDAAATPTAAALQAAGGSGERADARGSGSPPAATAPGEAAATADDPHAPASGLAMWLSYPFAYGLAYCLATRNPSPHNWLPISPMLSLAGAWLLVAGWRACARHLRPFATPVAGWVAGMLLAVALTVPAVGFAYQEALPSTLESLAEELVPPLRPVRGRFVYYEPAQGARLIAAAANADLPPDELDANPGGLADRADGAAEEDRQSTVDETAGEGTEEDIGVLLDDLTGPTAGPEASGTPGGAPGGASANLATSLLASDPLDPLTGALLDRAHRLVVRDWRGRAAVRPLRRLSERETPQLLLADVVVFAQTQLAGEQAALYRELVAAADRAVDAPTRFARNHGPGFVAAVVHWQQRGDAEVLAAWQADVGTGVLDVTLPPSPPGATAVSLELAVRKLRQLPRFSGMAIDGRRLDTVWVGRGGGPSTFFTVRVPAAATPRTVRVELAGPPPAEAGVTLRAVHWQRATPATQAAETGLPVR